MYGSTGHLTRRSGMFKQWVAPAGCDFEVEDFSRILVAPGRCDPLFARDLPFSPDSGTSKRYPS